MACESQDRFGTAAERIAAIVPGAAPRVGGRVGKETRKVLGVAKAKPLPRCSPDGEAPWRTASGVALPISWRGGGLARALGAREPAAVASPSSAWRLSAHPGAPAAAPAEAAPVEGERHLRAVEALRRVAVASDDCTTCCCARKSCTACSVMPLGENDKMSGRRTPQKRWENGRPNAGGKIGRADAARI